MSELRRYVYKFQKERIEALALAALKERGDESFVILVLDLNDKAARKIAIVKSSEKEVRDRIQAVKEKGGSPSLLLDTTKDDADVLLEDSLRWPILKSIVLPAGMVRVVVVGDGGITLFKLRALGPY